MNKVMAVCFANNTAKILVSNKAANTEDTGGKSPDWRQFRCQLAIAILAEFFIACIVAYIWEKLCNKDFAEYVYNL